MREGMVALRGETDLALQLLGIPQVVGIEKRDIAPARPPGRCVARDGCAAVAWLPDEPHAAVTGCDDVDDSGSAVG